MNTIDTSLPPDKRWQNMIAFLILTFVSLSFAAAPVAARNFTADPHTMSLSVSGTYYIIVSNGSNAPVTVTPRGAGDASFTFPSQDFIVPDQPKDSNFYVYSFIFQPTDYNTHSAQIFFSNATGVDTVTINGQDSAKRDEVTYGYRVSSDYFLRMDRHHMDIFTTGQNIQAAVKVENLLANNTNDTLHLRMFLTNADPTISLDKSTLNLAPGTGQDAMGAFNVLYKNNVRYPYNARATLIIDRATSPFNPDSIFVYVQDSGRQMTPQLTATSFVVLNTGVNDTTCGWVQISNPSGNDIVIDSVLPNAQGQGKFILKNNVNFPTRISPNNSISLGVCYVAPNAYDVMEYRMLDIYYHDSVGSAWLQTEMWAATGACIRINGGVDTMRVVDLGEVQIGSSVERSIMIVNITPGDITLNGVFDRPDPNWSVVGTTFPITMHKNDSTTVTFRFVANAADTTIQFGQFDLLMTAPGNTTCVTTIQFISRIKKSSTTHIELQPVAPRPIDMNSTSNDDIETLVFTNNTGADYVVQNVALTSSSHFRITSPLQLPITLHAGDIMSVTIKFSSEANGLYPDTLVIGSSNSAAHSYAINGWRTNGAAGVSKGTLSALDLEAYPNPAMGPVTLRMNGAANTHYEVIDLLGNVIASSDNANTWTWNRGSSAAGVYIVRASGVAVDGSPFLVSKRIVTGAR